MALSTDCLTPIHTDPCTSSFTSNSDSALLDADGPPFDCPRTPPECRAADPLRAPRRRLLPADCHTAQGGCVAANVPLHARRGALPCAQGGKRPQRRRRAGAQSLRARPRLDPRLLDRHAPELLPAARHHRRRLLRGAGHRGVAAARPHRRRAVVVSLTSCGDARLLQEVRIPNKPLRAWVWKSALPGPRLRSPVGRSAGWPRFPHNSQPESPARSGACVSVASVLAFVFAIGHYTSIAPPYRVRYSSLLLRGAPCVSAPPH